MRVKQRRKCTGNIATLIVGLFNEMVLQPFSKITFFYRRAIRRKTRRADTIRSVPNKLFRDTIKRRRRATIEFTNS